MSYLSDQFNYLDNRLKTGSSAEIAKYNTSEIQSALSQGGYWQISQPGTYYVYDNFTNNSSAFLTIAPGVTLTPISGSTLSTLSVFQLTTAVRDSGGNITGLAGPLGNRKLLMQPGVANAMLTKYGTVGFDIARAVTPGGTTMVIGTTDLTHSVTNDYPRFGAYTRKCVTGNTGTSQIRFTTMTPITHDPTEKALSVDVYIEQYVTEFAASNGYIDIEMSSSTTTSIGSNYSRWSFNATCLKQGWNTLKIRSADTVSSTAGSGNLPQGVSHPADVGTGFNWSTESCGFLSLRFNNMPNQNFYVSQIRLPAKALSVMTIGFDAPGYSNADTTFTSKVAPLFATYGVRSYTTVTNAYDMVAAGSTAWTRMAALCNTYGWDVINHTWDHGGTAIGTNTVLTSLVSASDVVTLTFPAAHGVTVGSKVKGLIRGSSIAVTNAVIQWDVPTTTTMTATVTGAGSATATGTITFNTFLSEVITPSSYLQSLVSSADVVTLTFRSAHGLNVGSYISGKIDGSSIAVTNITTTWLVATSTTLTATIASSGSTTATGTITFTPAAGEALTNDAKEARRLAAHEFGSIGNAMRSVGFARGAVFTAYPNNSYMEKSTMEYAASVAGIKVGRSDRNGYTNVNEYGIDNPLCMGSWNMTSGTSGTQTSTLEAKVAGAISRGDHIHIYGHFILDDTDSTLSAYWPLTANGTEYPPGMNGNPNPPSAGQSITGGWWYYSQLARLFSSTIGPAIANGTLLVMSPSEYVAYMGLDQ